MDGEGKHGGIFTDAAWDGALTAALGHAEANDFRISQNADVRWRVELVNEADAYARQDVATAETEPWKPGSLLHGRSAGAAFLIGLVYLGQRAREAVAIGSEIRSKVITLLPLLVLPTLPEHGPLQELGATEQPKLDALERHLANLTLIFPETHREGMAPGAMLAPNVTTLVRFVVDRIKSESVPYTIPPASRAGHYVGAGKVGALMDSLRQPGVVVVHGPAGIGKSALVFEAVGRLFEGREGAFHGGRLYIDLSKRMPLVVNPPWNSGESALPFEDLPRHFNLWVTDWGLNSLQEAMLKDIVSGLGKVPFEDLQKLKTQARDLLAGRSVLVVLEGAENVPEADIGGFLEPLGGNTHIAWLTRRKPNPGVQGLNGRPAHEVLPLSLEDSRELLCHHAGLDPTTLDDAARAALDSIAHDAEFIPQFLVWAGRAIGHDAVATPKQLAEEIHRDRLTEIADPTDRQNENAHRFLESSFARIQPALAASTRRLFATLSTFHPAHGAPVHLWALAAGLDTAQPTQRREFSAARRELLSLRLARLDEKQNAHPVHALAGILADALWREQPAQERLAALSVLCQTAAESIKKPLPPGWFHNKDWVAGRTAEAAHYDHWLGEAISLESDLTEASPGSEETRLDSTPYGALLMAWTEFLDDHAEPHPLLALKDTAWKAVCRHLLLLTDGYPEESEFQIGLSHAWDQVGDVLMIREDWAAAEMAFKEAMVIEQSLVRNHPAETDFRDALAHSYSKIGKTYESREDWDGAERSFKKGITIRRQLVKENPRVPKFQGQLAILWDRVGRVRAAKGAWTSAKAAFTKAKTINEKLAETRPDLPESPDGLFEWLDRLGRVCSGQQDWVGAETAFQEAIKIGLKQIDANPDEPNYQRGVAICWGQIGHARKARQDLEGAEAAFSHSLEIHKMLAAKHPDMPESMRDLAVAWDDLSKVYEARQDLVRAEEALTHALKIDEKLTAAYADVPGFVRDLATSWFRLAELREARNDLAGAEDALNHALKYDRKLAEDHPDSPDFQAVLGATLGAFGNLCVQRKHWADAEAALTKSLEIHTKLVAERPEVAQFQGGLSTTWCYIASMCKNLRDWAGAESACKTAIGLNEKGAISHPDLDFRPILSTLWVELGDVRVKQDDWAGAEVAFKNALEIDANRAMERPEGRDLQRCLAVVWERLGDVRTEQQDWLGAETAFKNEVEIGSKLVGRYPDVLDFHGILDSAWRGLGKVCIERQDWVGAETAFRNAIEVDKNATAAHPDATEPQFYLSFSWDGLAIVAGKRGDHEGEEQALIESLRLCEAVADRWLKTARFEDRAIYQALRLAQALHRRGREEEAASPARRGLARAERLAALLQEIGAEMTERQKQMIARLAKLLGPETDPAGQ